MNELPKIAAFALMHLQGRFSDQKIVFIADHAVFQSVPFEYKGQSSVPKLTSIIDQALVSKQYTIFERAHTTKVIVKFKGFSFCLDFLNNGSLDIQYVEGIESSALDLLSAWELKVKSYEATIGGEGPCCVSLAYAEAYRDCMNGLKSILTEV